MKYRIFFIALVDVMLIAGCSYPYRPPQFESARENADFPGLVDQIAHSSSGLHIIWIHGMCPHSRECWATPSVNRLASLLGANGEIKRYGPIDSGGLIERYSFVASGKQITADMIVWSPLLHGLRRNLCFDSKRDADPDVTAACDVAATYPYPRAKLNETMKSHIMNACLTDALIYAGSFGAFIRASLRDGLASVLGDEAPLEGDGLVFISESLGSKVLYDVLTQILNEEGVKANKVAEKLRATRQFYMFANQLPILDLTAISAPEKDVRVRGAPRTSFENLVQRVLIERAKTPKPAAGPSGMVFDSLHVVAFTDPNDLLSYRMPQWYFGGREDVLITNVLTSNSPILFGLVENPAPAHTGYRENPDAMTLLICGRTPSSDDCGDSVRKSLTGVPDLGCIAP